MGLVHDFVSGKPAASDASLVDGPNWDANHKFSGGNLGALLYQGASDYVTGINSVALGQVLVSAGAGTAPAWSPTLSITSLALSAGLTAGDDVTVTGGKALVIDDSLFLSVITATNSNGSYIGTLITGETTRAASTSFKLLDLKANLVSQFSVRGDGAVTAAGALAVTGAATITGALTVNASSIISTTGETQFTLNSDSDANSADTDVLLRFTIDAGTLKGLVGYDQGLDVFVAGYDGSNRIMVNSAGNLGVGTAAASTGAKLHVDQASTTAAIPVLILDQGDDSEDMIEFVGTIGVGNAIEAVGAKTLTTTHFIKVTLPGALTRYIPVGTIA